MRMRAIAALLCIAALGLLAAGPAGAHEKAFKANVQGKLVQLPNGSTYSGRVSVQDCAPNVYVNDCPPSVSVRLLGAGGSCTCTPNRSVRLFKDGVQLAQTRTNKQGEFSFSMPGLFPKGTYVSSVDRATRKTKGHVQKCRSGESSAITV